MFTDKGYQCDSCFKMIHGALRICGGKPLYSWEFSFCNIQCEQMWINGLLQDRQRYTELLALREEQQPEPHNVPDPEPPTGTAEACATAMETVKVEREVKICGQKVIEHKKENDHQKDFDNLFG